MTKPRKHGLAIHVLHGLRAAKHECRMNIEFANDEKANACLASSFGFRHSSLFSHRYSAIDAKNLPGDVTRFRGSKKCDGAGDVFGRTSFAERNSSLNGFLNFIR
jgi:hypothetical protein